MNWHYISFKNQSFQEQLLQENGSKKTLFQETTDTIQETTVGRKHCFKK